MADHKGSLTFLLESSAYLLESKKDEYSSSGKLQYLLHDRLQSYYDREGIEGGHQPGSLQEAQLTTAKEGLSILEKIERLLLLHDPSDPTQNPVLGTRDLAKLRTLISVVLKWGTEPLLAKVNDTWKVDLKGKGRRIVEVSDEDSSYATLSSTITRIMTILFPNGVQGNMSTTVISSSLTNRHLVDILQCSISLGWLPASLSTAAMPTVGHLRPFTMRILSILSPAMLITALGTILSDGANLPVHVRRISSSFMTQQLLRPGGVLGLCESVCGEEETSGDGIKLDKLEQVSRTLMSVPAKMTPEDYLEIVVPRITQLLSEKVPASYRKIAAFTLSQMLGSDRAFQHQDIAAPLVCATLHLPFTQIPIKDALSQAPPSPSTALSNLIILISNCDPSPELISNLLSPIILQLYSLFFYLGSQRTADPILKESVQGLLVTWGKIVDASKAVDLLWSLVQTEYRQYWSAGLDGSIRLIPRPEETMPLNLLTPEDLKRTQEEGSLDVNLFDLYPDPAHFVSFLKLLDKGDIVSELFVKILDAYHQSKMAKGDPMKSLHYLQIFMQMQLQLLGDSSSSILRKPDQLLSFINQVLESTTAPRADERAAQSPSRLELDDITDEDSDDLSGNDSDDDDPNSEVIKPDDEMVETTINLLLSVLEIHESLSARNAPILNDIFSLLEPITYSDTFTLRPLAREARMVITARSASTSTSRPGKSRDSEEESAQEIYQKSLKLLQDPILPVRAHGLLLLRQLVTPKPKSAKDAGTDPALVPAILSIFLQSIQDEDSYIFLNAVQGLAGMVDGFGKDVLRGLVRDYSGGLEAMASNSMSQQDLDVRIRIGEALSTVIIRCGPSLGKYGDILIPALFSVFRSKGIPVTLRTSSLSLLADAISTYPLAMLPYTEDLAQGMIDMVQVESRSTPTPKPTLKKAAQDSGTGEEAAQKTTGDNDHLSVDPTYPPLRRAGIHLLALLIRATTRVIDEGHHILPFSGAFVKRAHITLGYVAAMDDDTVVRVMAREVNEELSSLESYLLGQDS